MVERHKNHAEHSQRSSNEGVRLSLSGRIEIEDVAELQRLIGLEAGGQAISLDLQDVTLIDRDAVSFLECCEMEGIKLDNCPAYPVSAEVDRRRKRRQSNNRKR